MYRFGRSGTCPPSGLDGGMDGHGWTWTGTCTSGTCPPSGADGMDGHGRGHVLPVRVPLLAWMGMDGHGRGHVLPVRVPLLTRRAGGRGRGLGDMYFRYVSPFWPGWAWMDMDGDMYFRYVSPFWRGRHGWTWMGTCTSGTCPPSSERGAISKGPYGRTGGRGPSLAGRGAPGSGLRRRRRPRPPTLRAGGRGRIHGPYGGAG